MTAPPNSAGRRAFRLLLWFILVVETPVQLYLLIDWATRLGFVGGIIKWFASAKLDTIYAAAVIDFTCAIAILTAWLLYDSRLRGRRAILWPMVVLTIVFPSLALAIYFLFLRHRDPVRS